jgi:hypothetical protein
MVKGLETFKKYFGEYSEQYVLIGGTACDISFADNQMKFRATRDLDMVLVVEALTKEFGERFWQFIQEGKYANKVKNSGKAQFYRFDKPMNPDFPSMIELFSRIDYIPMTETTLVPIHIDNAVSSLSAILLNDEYYQALLQGRCVIDGISVLKPTYLIPFKARAWIDLREKKMRGVHVDSRDIKKHKNDILRLSTEMLLEECQLPQQVQQDMEKFIGLLEEEPNQLTNNVPVAAVIELLKRIYAE